MIFTLTVLLVIANPTNSCANVSVSLVKFFADYLSFFSFTRPILVVSDNVGDVAMSSSVGENTQWWTIGYDDEDFIAVNDTLYDMDAAVFVGFGGHEQILKAAVLNLKLETITRRFNARADLSMNLDSKVVFYKVLNASTIEVSEEYTVRNSPVIRKVFGNWTESKGLLIEEPSRWERRADLRGVQLKQSFLTYGIVSMILKDEERRASGIMGETLHELADTLNFTIATAPPPDGNFGNMDPDSETFNGVVGVLSRGDADVSCTGLAQTWQRDTAIDYSISILYYLFTLIAPSERPTEVKYWVYLEIIALESWLTLAALSAITGFVFYAAINISSDKFCSSTKKRRKVETLSRVGQACLAGKVAALSSTFGVYLTFQYYTADFMAIITVGSSAPPIRSFSDILDSSYYKVVTLSDSGEQIELQQSPLGSAKRTYYDTRMVGNPAAFVKNETDGLRAVLDRPGTLLFAAQTLATDTRFEALKLKDTFPVPVACAYPKGSQFRELFDHFLHKMLQGGTIHKLEKRFVAAKREGPDWAGEGAALGYWNLVFPFLVLALGVASSLLLLIVEKVALFARGNQVYFS